MNKSLIWLWLSLHFGEGTKIYNDLLSVSSDVRIADTFYAMVKDTSQQLTEADFAGFKLLVRKELGLSSKGSALISKTKPTEEVK